METELNDIHRRLLEIRANIKDIRATMERNIEDRTTKVKSMKI